MRYVMQQNAIKTMILIQKWLFCPQAHIDSSFNLENGVPYPFKSVHPMCLSFGCQCMDV